MNVNLLSHLEKDRVTYLMQEEEKSFTTAKQQAQREILAIFGIEKADMMASELLDISQDGEDNAILLAVSAILQGNNSVAELSELLANFITDIREDGVLDSESTRDKIRVNAMALRLTDIRQHLEVRYEELGVDATIPNFEQYVDSDGDGFLNKDEDDTPDDFTFEAQVDVAVDTLMVSNEITISGLKDGGKSIARVEGGTLIVNDQKVTADSIQVGNGDRVKLVLRSSPEYATPSVAKLTINTLARQFSVTTDDYTPNDFNFTIIETAKRDSLYTSETITLTGLPHATPIRLDEGILLVNEQVISSNQTSVKDGDEIAIRLNASTEYETSATATVRIGAMSKMFKITTAFNPWQRKADITLGRRGKRFSVNDEIYTVDQDMMFHQYNVSKDQWTTKTKFPGEHRSEFVIFIIDNKAFIGSGSNSTFTAGEYIREAERDFWEYNFLTDQWTKKADFLGENTNDVTSFVANGKGYVVGGYYDDPNKENGYPRTDSKQFWEYDPLADRWSRKTDFPAARSGAASIAFNGKVYLGGGNLTFYRLTADDYWSYDPVADRWTEEANFTEQLPLHHHGYGNCSFFSIDNTLYFMATYRDVYLKKYDTIHDLWEDEDIELPKNWENGIDIVSGKQKAFFYAGQQPGYDGGPVEVWEFTPPQD